MPNRIPPKTLGEHLESVEAKLDRLIDRQGFRNKVAVTTVVVLALGIWLTYHRQESADKATDERIQAGCGQQNRSFGDYTDGLVRASGGNPKDPALRVKLAELPVRDCTDAGNKAYFEHSGPIRTCRDLGRVSDGKGFCIVPSTTTTSLP